MPSSGEVTDVQASGAERGGWYHGWTIVAVCILVQIAGNGLCVNAYSLFLRDWSNDLHTPISNLQLAPAAMGLVSALTGGDLGHLADRKPARWLFGVGLILLAVFHLAVSFVAAPWQIVALYATVLPLGVVLAGALTANALISRWFVRRLGLALGLSAFGLGMATVVLPPVVAALAPQVGWRMIWRAAGVLIALVVTPLAIATLRNRPAPRDGTYYLTGAAGARAHSHAAGPGGLSVGQVFARKNFWLLIAVYLPILAIHGSSMQNLAPIAASHGLSRETAGALLSALGVSHVGSTLLFGLLSDRFGNRLPFAGLALVVACGALLLGLGHGLPLAFVAAVLIGAGGGLFPLLAAGIAVEFGSAGFGRAFGLAMAFVPVIALGPFTIAKTQEATGSYVPALAGLAALAVVGGLLCLTLLRERRGGHPTPAEHAATLHEAPPPAAGA